VAKRGLVGIATAVAASVVVLVIVAPFGAAQAQAAIPPGKNVYRIPTSEKVCAITFDDWYDADRLESILATLKAAGVKATFFPTGACEANDPALVRSIVAAGCRIGNHSYSHPVLTKLTTAQIRSEIQMTEEAAAQAGAPDPAPLFRTPYGSWSRQVRSVLAAEGYVNVLWSVTAGDTAPGGRLPSTAIKLIMRGLKPGSIILMHASEWCSAQCLPELIRQIQARGYRIVDLAEALFPAEQRASRYQQSSPLLSYSGDWTTLTSSSHSGGSICRTGSQGAAVTASFTGTTFEWLAMKGPDYGKATVTIDGSPPREVDLYSPSYLHRRSVFKVADLADGSHSAIIAYADAKNDASTGYYVDIDALRVSGELLQAFSNRPLWPRHWLMDIWAKSKNRAAPGRMVSVGAISADNMGCYAT
jgi:peptidoglycan/xylan/chitin deacetylase (PgdA/CDA1 family)